MAEYDNTPPAPREGGTAKARYDRLRDYREPFLLRARDCARQTIPSILPPLGHNATSTLPQPYQGLGARGTSNVANRLMTAMLPAGTNHFRLSIPIAALVKEGLTEPPQDMVHKLASVENIIQEEIDRLNWREATNLVAQHLVVTGNCLEYLQPDGNIRVYRIDQYLVVRDPAGTITEILIAEEFSEDSLPQRLRDMRAASPSSDRTTTGKSVCLYTWVRREPNGSWKAHQELEDKIVPGSDGTYPADMLPFWPLRWSAVIGEDYGRGKVEEHWPDLFTLDGLTKALIEGAAMASRNIPMIRPNAAGGLNLRRRIATAKNGDIIVGNPEDVNMLQFQNTAGMQFVAQQVQQFRQELGAAFLLNSAMRRDAERVTATELRQMAEELDGSLGGIYSILNQDMARPRLRRLIYQLQAANKLPKWPAGMVEPTLLVGLEALGRQRDLQRISEVLSIMQPLPPEIIQAYPKWSVILDKAFVASGLPDAVNTQQEVQAAQERQALIQALQQTAPTVADKMLPSADAQAPAPGTP